MSPTSTGIRGRLAYVPLLLAGLFALSQIMLDSSVAAQSGFGEIKPVVSPTPTLAPLQPLSAGFPGGTPGESKAAEVPPRRQASVPGLSGSVIVVLGVGLIVVVATVFVVASVVLKPSVVINVVSGRGVSAIEGPPPSDWIEGDIVRMGKPPEGTLKILPGRFSVEDGERVIDLRIFRTTGADRVETTIGREPGQPYRHIQLKPLSVSGKHAKFSWENGAYTIINYSRTNPTLVNGESLPEGASRRIVDEDRIEIGEVAMTYHEV